MSAGPYKLIYEVLLIDDGSKDENLDPLYDFADRWKDWVNKTFSFRMLLMSCASKLYKRSRFCTSLTP